MTTFKVLLLVAIALLHLAAAGKHNYKPHDCYSKCMSKKHRVRKSCDLRYCKITRCGPRRHADSRRGGSSHHARPRKFRCVPRHQKAPRPVYKPVHPIYEPELPILPPACSSKCYRKYAKAAHDCFPSHCGIVSCLIYHHGKYIHGYACGEKSKPSASPTPTPTPSAAPSPSPMPKCDESCYPAWKFHNVKKDCNPHYCKVAHCDYKKYGWNGYKKTKHGYNCVHKHHN